MPDNRIRINRVESVSGTGLVTSGRIEGFDIDLWLAKFEGSKIDFSFKLSNPNDLPADSKSDLSGG